MPHELLGVLAHRLGERLFQRDVLQPVEFDGDQVVDAARDKVPDALSGLNDVLDDLHLVLHGGEVVGLHGRDVDVLEPEGDLLLDCGGRVGTTAALDLANELVQALEGIVAVAQDSGELLRPSTVFCKLREMIRDQLKKMPHVTDLAMEHDGVGFVGALGDVVLLPLVRHDLPGYAEGRRRDQDSAAGDGGRHADPGQRKAAPGSEWS